MNKNINKKLENTKLITIGGGCFWCIDSCFSNFKGVVSCIPGFSGGNYNDNTINSKIKEDAEVVQIKYDLNITSIIDILKAFFSIHDPTQLNKQGNDIGNEYRSIICYHDEEQKNEAERIISILNDKIYNNKIVTLIQPFKNFTKASEYHNKYFNKNPNDGYCIYVIKPKLEKFKKIFEDLKNIVN